MRLGVPRCAVRTHGLSGAALWGGTLFPAHMLRSGSLEQVFWEQPRSQASVGIFPTAFLGPGRSAELTVPVSACGELLLAQKKKEPAVLRTQRDILGDLNPEGGREGRWAWQFPCALNLQLSSLPEVRALPAPCYQWDQRSRARAWSSETWVLVLALPLILWANLAILVT